LLDFGSGKHVRLYRYNHACRDCCTLIRN
jgi:hypothetical protein